MVWSYKKLSELAEVSSGGTPKRSNKEFWGGDIPWYSSGELNDFNTIPPKEHITESGLTSSNAKLFPRGSLLIGMYDTAALKMSLLDREGTFNQAIAGVKPNKNINLSFILYAINSIKPELLKLRRGVRQKNLNQGMIKDILIPDIPLIEQERIVALLDTMFADLEQTRAKTEQNLRNARELFDSSLKKIFESKGANWERISLFELLERKYITSHLDGNHGGAYPRKSEFIDSGVPYISAKCLIDGKIDMTKAKYLSAERAGTLRKGIAKDEDVLFAHNATVGPVAILETTEEKVILGTSLTYYRCNKKHIIPKYLAQYMISFEFTSQYTSIMRQSTRNQVPITKQREFIHIIPPIAEQEE